MDFKQGKIFNIVHGNYEIGIITNQSNKEKVLGTITDENVLRVVEDCVVVSLMYSKDYLFTPGVIYNVLRLVAWENINILSITLTPQELNIVVDRKDTMRAYNTLEKLVCSVFSNDVRNICFISSDSFIPRKSRIIIISTAKDAIIAYLRKEPASPKTIIKPEIVVKKVIITNINIVVIANALLRSYSEGN